MALHDYRCDACCSTLVDYYVPMQVGATVGAPNCPICDQPMHWIPAVGRMDANTGMKAFTIEETVRGQTVRTEISNLSDLRRVEREHEQLARNGEGRPLIWRDYSNDRSNGDVHTLVPAGGALSDPHGAHAAAQRHIAKQAAKGQQASVGGAAIRRTHGDAE